MMMMMMMMLLLLLLVMMMVLTERERQREREICIFYVLLFMTTHLESLGRTELNELLAILSGKTERFSGHGGGIGDRSGWRIGVHVTEHDPRRSTRGDAGGVVEERPLDFEHLSSLKIEPDGPTLEGRGVRAVVDQGQGAELGDGAKKKKGR